MKKTLIIETVSPLAFTDSRFSGPAAPAGEQVYRVSYEDPVELLRFMTAERVEIVKMPLELGPLPQEEIAVRVGRNGGAFADDLRILLASEVIRLNEKYEYCFDHDGFRVILK